MRLCFVSISLSNTTSSSYNEEEGLEKNSKMAIKFVTTVYVNSQAEKLHHLADAIE